MYNASKLRTLLFACIAALATPAIAERAARDEIVLTDGSRLFGKVTAVREGAVTVETDFAGALSIPVDKVESLRSDDPAVLLLRDDNVVNVQPLVIDGGQVAAGPDGAGQGYPLAQLKIVNPEDWETGRGYHWTGLVNFALELERGNSEKDQLDYKLASEWLSTRDRYSFEWRGEQDETEGEKTADNWLANLGYDYFLADPWYVGARGRVEEDEFADIDLRYLVGPHIGRQFFDTPRLTLSGELGLAYADDDYIVAEDEQYAAATWALDIASNYLGGESRLYLDQDGVWNLDETSNVIVDTAIGLAFPLMWNLEAAAEVLLEYDGNADGDVDDLDETYRLRLGYTW